MRYLCIIVDNKANDLVGNPLIVKHEAVAIRTFGDICSAREPNAVNTHIEDHDLYIVGEIPDEDNPTQVIYTARILITGAQWKAAQQANLQQE